MLQKLRSEGLFLSSAPVSNCQVLRRGGSELQVSGGLFAVLLVRAVAACFVAALLDQALVSIGSTSLASGVDGKNFTSVGAAS